MLTTAHRLVRLLTAVAVLATTATAGAADLQPATTPGRLFRVVNASFDSVTSMEVADASAAGYTAIDLGAPLQGGLASTTVRLPDGACSRDLRMTFRDGRREVYRDIDVCRVTGLRLSPLKRLPQGAALSQGALLPRGVAVLQEPRLAEGARIP